MPDTASNSTIPMPLSVTTASSYTPLDKQSPSFVSSTSSHTPPDPIDVHECCGEVYININPNCFKIPMSACLEIREALLARYKGLKLTSGITQTIKNETMQALSAYLQTGKIVLPPTSLRPKLTLASLKVNDYICFESLTDLWGLPAGHAAKPGDRRYFRVIAVRQGIQDSPVCVMVQEGNNRFPLSDDAFSSDNVLTVKAQFPIIAQDWRLRLSFPAPHELPLHLRLRRAVANLFTKKG